MRSKLFLTSALESCSERTYVYPSVSRPRVNILLSSRLYRAKMAPDESPKDPMAMVFHHAAVFWMSCPNWVSIVILSDKESNSCFSGLQKNEPVIKLGDSVTFVPLGFVF